MEDKKDKRVLRYDAERTEQREQNDACINYAESRRSCSEAEGVALHYAGAPFQGAI